MKSWIWTAPSRNLQIRYGSSSCVTQLIWIKNDILDMNNSVTQLPGPWRIYWLRDTTALVRAYFLNNLFYVFLLFKHVLIKSKKTTKNEQNAV